ncbi:hypothetical protein PE36_05548 [Moritella sp. PE36]|nr:hypothetical protein PE36_05548 [Moritella sp. PE36]
MLTRLVKRNEAEMLFMPTQTLRIDNKQKSLAYQMINKA